MRVCVCAQDGKSALDYATQQGKDDVAQLIEVRLRSNMRRLSFHLYCALAHTIVRALCVCVVMPLCSSLCDAATSLEAAYATFQSHTIPIPHSRIRPSFDPCIPPYLPIGWLRSRTCMRMRRQSNSNQTRQRPHARRTTQMRRPCEGRAKGMEPLPLPLRRPGRLCSKTNIVAAAATQSNRILEHACQLCHCFNSSEFMFSF